MKKYKYIDTTQPVTLEVSTPELPNFTIEGSFEDVAPIHEELVKSFAVRPSTNAHRKPSVVARITRSHLRHLLIEIRTLAYDARYHRNFHAELVKRRNNERDLRFLRSVGLLENEVGHKL